MIRSIGLFTVVLGLFVGGALTFSGLLAPLFPTLEMINHFRPFILYGFVILLFVSLVLRLLRWLVFIALFVALNAILFVLPITFQASAATPVDRAAPSLKVISFNMWVGNRTLDDIERFLRDERADVVLLQEIDAKHAATLLPKLADLYPHQLSCATSSSCLLALLSRRPWTQADFLNRGLQNPPMIWARFGTGDESYRIASLHQAWPYQATAQVNNIDWLIAWRQRVTEPLLIAGDFNLTPFSWKLTKFSWETGLKRFSTYQHSWPGHRYAPIFLIDHMFSSDTIRPLDVHTGPSLGSDHLPVVATVALR